MLVFKFLHIASMFGAVTLVFGSIVFLDLLARRSDVAAYLRVDALAQRTTWRPSGCSWSGIFITIPRYNNIREVATNTDADAAGDAIARLVRDPRHVALVAIVTILWLAVIFVMVVKPTVF